MKSLVISTSEVGKMSTLFWQLRLFSNFNSKIAIEVTDCLMTYCHWSVYNIGNHILHLIWI